MSRGLVLLVVVVRGWTRWPRAPRPATALGRAWAGGVAAEYASIQTVVSFIEECNRWVWRC